MNKVKMKLNIVFNSDTKFIENIVSSVVSICKIYSKNNNELFDISVPLILDELLRNAILHGNKNDKSKIVKVEVEIDHTSFSLSIIDEGKGFNFNKVLNDIITKPPDYKSNHGRGILLVKKYSSELIYSLNGKKVNVVVICGS